MRPVETAAFSKLGERPLKNPPGPSSRMICLTQSRRPLYVRTWERNGKKVKQEKIQHSLPEKEHGPKADHGTSPHAACRHPSVYCCNYLGSSYCYTEQWGGGSANSNDSSKSLCLDACQIFMLPQHFLSMVQARGVIISHCAAAVLHPLCSLRRDNFSDFRQKENTATALGSPSISSLHVSLSHREGLTPYDTSILQRNSIPHWEKQSSRGNGVRPQIPIPEFPEVQTDLLLRAKEFEVNRKFSRFKEEKIFVKYLYFSQQHTLRR